VYSPPINDGYRPHITLLCTVTTTLTGIGHFNAEAFDPRKNIIKLLRWKVSVITHHTTAGTTEADTKELFLVRNKKSEIIETHLTNKGDKTCSDCLF
jgi:hypothetical protein